MKVHQLIKKLSGLHQNDEVLLTDSDNGEYGSEVDTISVRRVYDEHVRNGERRVAVITMKSYGDCESYEFIDEEVSA